MKRASPPTTRLACCFVFLAAACCLGRTSTAGAAALPLTDSFKDEPAEALIHRLQPGRGASVSSPGIVVIRKRRWLSAPRGLLIDSTLRNTGKTAVRVGNVAVADWAFRVAGGPKAPPYRDLAYRRDTWYGSTYWTGPDWTRVGKDWHHPGVNTPSVRRFTAPRDGRVTITGRVFKADLNGDGVRASIRHGRKTLWTAEIAGKDAKGAAPNLTVNVRKGDAVRFVVHKLGRIFYDTTRWDPVVTYAGGARYQASRGFSTSTQGRGGWSYEMEVGPQARRPLPRVCGISTDFALRDETVDVGKPVELDDSDTLPLMLVTDAAGRTGIALAAGAPRRWRLKADLAGDGLLSVRLSVGVQEGGLSLKPGESVRLPGIVLAAYRGGSHAGLATLQRILDCKAPPLRVERLKERFAAVKSTDLSLLTMVQAEWRREDKLTEKPVSYAGATARHLDKAMLLLADLRRGRGDAFLADEARRLERLAAAAGRPGLGLDDRRSLYGRLRWLKREIALANPLMQFGKLLFCKRVPTSYSHLVMQYFGWRARAGGGLFILDRPGRSLQCRDLTGGKLEDGCVLEPCLSYDATRVVFSYVQCKGKSYRDAQVRNAGEGYYHVWEVNVDGTGLRRLTDGPYDDLMPAWLPDGGIAFSSTRRRGYARCFGPQFSRRWHVYTLHRMDGDGRNVRTISFHDTNEWFPTVADDGRIVYARWDYVDRDAVTHQNLWAARPDGTNPTTLWGNATSSPHCAFQAKAIPGTGKFVFTASAHHSITAGAIAIVDPSIHYDGHGAVTRVTPEVPFPEAEGRNIREYYCAPWPLSDPSTGLGAGKYFLVAYSPTPLVWEPGANLPNALGIYLLDKFGNRELIYRDPDIGSTNPIPLVPRPAPPVLPSSLPADAPPTGEMLLTDVYRGLGDVPRGGIKLLRVIQVFPKTTPVANNPRMGIAGEENGRAILGTVPVEPDGSARFIVPARTPILFQALDGNGLAYQTMRSVTYLQPGERVSCAGCHESRMTAPGPAGPMARRRAPSRITPGPRDGRPFSYVQTVQPVLDKHCVKCHGPKKTEGKIDLTGARSGTWTRSYVSLTRDAKLVPRYPARNQIQVTPAGGVYGAAGSGLMKMLRKGHEEVKLGDEEIRRLAAWIDCNAIFYGSPSPADHPKQLSGQPVPMPDIR